MAAPTRTPIELASKHRIITATTFFAAYTAAMLAVESRMRRTGGPGVVAFELAGTAAKAEQIMDVWGDDGRRAARLSMWLDFGYMTSYGTLLALLIDRRRQHRQHPAWLPLAAAGAVAGDAIEGVSLLRVLDRRNVAANARRARIAALTKFAILAAGLGYSI